MDREKVLTGSLLGSVNKGRVGGQTNAMVV